MVKFYYNCFINEASKHAPFEVSYGFQPATHADRFLPFTGAPAHVAERLTKLASDRDVVRELLTSLSNVYMVAHSSIPPPIFVDYFVFLFSKGVHINSQKFKHLRDRRLGPFQVIENKVDLKSYRLKLPSRCRLHPAFHCDLLSNASTNSTLPLRHPHVVGGVLSGEGCSVTTIVTPIASLVCTE